MPLIHASDPGGSTYGASISLIIAESEPGCGPRLHRHAYDETWVVQEGKIVDEWLE